MPRWRLLVAVCVGMFVLIPTGFAGSRDGPTPRARIGMNYFDGWTRSLSNFHFNGLVRPDANGVFPGREPLSGWRDDSSAAIRASLRWAHEDGIDFFYFDWFYNPQEPDPNLNEALDTYAKLGDHAGVGDALMYVNIDPFVVPQSMWQATVEQWVTQYFTQPDYAKVNGEPLLFIIDSDRFNQQWGGQAGVNAALETLRLAARAHGLPGVFVVGSQYVGTCVNQVGWDYFGASIRGESWDAMTQQSYPSAACYRDGPQPYADIVAAGEESWNRYAASFGPPNIPSVQDGWDPRPWNERIAGHLWWFERTPAEFGAFVGNAIDWVLGHPTQQVDPSRPLVLVTSWNEIGEGEAVIPNLEDGYGYGQALAQAVGIPWSTPSFTVSVASGKGGAVASQPSGIACPGQCHAAFDTGRQVSLVATARRKYVFRGWSGPCHGRARTCTFIVEGDETARASFARR